MADCRTRRIKTVIQRKTDIAVKKVIAIVVLEVKIDVNLFCTLCGLTICNCSILEDVLTKTEHIPK